jgi:hypothetical protein
MKKSQKKFILTTEIKPRDEIGPADNGKRPEHDGRQKQMYTKTAFSILVVKNVVETLEYRRVSHNE